MHSVTFRRLGAGIVSIRWDLRSVEEPVRGVHSVIGTCAKSPVPYRRIAFPVVTILRRSDDKKYVPPGQPGSIVSSSRGNENFIGGKWLAPTHGKYRVDLAPATPGRHRGGRFHAGGCRARAGRCPRGEGRLGRGVSNRASEVLNRSPTRREDKDMLAVAESWENGKPVRETLAADIPLVVDHFRYFAAAARAEEGRSTEIEEGSGRLHFREPLGVVGQIIPFNFPLLMAA